MPLFKAVISQVYKEKVIIKDSRFDVDKNDVPLLKAIGRIEEIKEMVADAGAKYNTRHMTAKSKHRKAA